MAEATPATPTEPEQRKSIVAPIESVSAETAADEGPKTYAEIVAAAKSKKENEYKAQAAAAIAAVESAPVVALAASAAVGAGLAATSEVEIPVKRTELAAETIGSCNTWRN